MDDQQQTPQTGDNSALEHVRDKAVSLLIPLLDELEDSPEHKFDICLSAIRSTDRSELLAKALQFAEQIEDKSEKAQALIDVANEATVRLSATSPSAPPASA